MREKIIEIINKISDQRPYKKSGDADSYSDYNQGWSDACSVIESEIESLKPSQSAEEFLKKYYPEQLIYSNMDFLVLMLEQYASQAQGESEKDKIDGFISIFGNRNYIFTRSLDKKEYEMQAGIYWKNEYNILPENEYKIKYPLLPLPF